MLQSFSKKLNLIIARNLFNLLNRVQSKYTRNDDKILDAFDDIEKESTTLLMAFFPKVKKVLTLMNSYNKKKFNKAIEEKLGVSLKRIIERENIRDSFNMAIEQNLNLIKSLTDRQLSRVKNVVLSELRAGNYQASTIRKLLRDDFGISERHAKMIARDQSHKMTANLNQLRYENLGVTHYIWRTAHDTHVRGNPAGPYAKAKYSHWDREGKVFAFNKPPKDGNPGEPINCRCHAEPILDNIIDRSNNG